MKEIEIEYADGKMTFFTDLYKEMTAEVNSQVYKYILVQVKSVFVNLTTQTRIELENTQTVQPI